MKTILIKAQKFFYKVLAYFSAQTFCASNDIKYIKIRHLVKF